MTRTYPLTVRYTAKPSAAIFSGSEYWLRMEQIKGDDRATTADIAQVVDALYDIDPCSELEETAAPVAPIMPTVEQLIGKAGPILNLAECNRRRSGEYTARLKIVYSHPDDPQEKYKLTVSVGEVRSISKVTEDITLTLNVKETAFVTLDYPVSQPKGAKWPGSAKWLGSVYNETEGAIPPPAIVGQGNLLTWEVPCTGTIIVKVPTIYDVAVIVVPGIPLYATSPVGKSQDSRARAFYHYQVYETDITMVDEDASADQQTLAQICGYANYTGGGESGSTNDLDTPEEDDPDEEEDDGPPMGCLDPAEYLEDPDFYKDKCCTPKPGGLILPDCKTVAVPRPIVGIDQDVVDRMTEEYRGKIEFIAVGPGPDGCGRRFYEQVVPSLDCCSGVGPLLWDEEITPATIGSNSSAIIALRSDSGKVPLYWKIRGQGFFFDPQYKTREHVSYSFGIHIWTHNACGAGYIEVTDGCTTITRPIRATDGSWHALPQSSWPPPAGITHYDALVDPGVFEVIVGEYKYRQQFSRISASTDYRVDEWSYDTICALPPPTPMAELVAEQQAQIDPDVPQYISNDIFMEACQRGDSAPYSSFSDVDQFPWSQCAQGILCLEYQRARPGIIYQCHFQSAGLKPLNIISIWKWGC